MFALVKVIHALGFELREVQIKDGLNYELQFGTRLKKIDYTKLKLLKIETGPIFSLVSTDFFFNSLSTDCVFVLVKVIHALGFELREVQIKDGLNYELQFGTRLKKINYIKLKLLKI